MIYTQKDLKSKTNKELNKIIYELEGLKPSDIQLMCMDVIEQLNQEPELRGAFDDDGSYYGKDYCVVANDMMPLAFEAGLQLLSHKNAHDKENKAYMAIARDDYCCADSKMFSVNDNPLRALAIVYILVKQG